MSVNVQILRDARELLSDPKKWTKDSYAKDAVGEPVLARSSDAVCFCAIGAVRRVAPPGGTIGPLALLSEAIGSEYIGDWNDERDRTHADVLHAFDRAIALAQQPEPHP